MGGCWYISRASKVCSALLQHNSSRHSELRGTAEKIQAMQRGNPVGGQTLVEMKAAWAAFPAAFPAEQTDLWDKLPEPLA